MLVLTVTLAAASAAATFVSDCTLTPAVDCACERGREANTEMRVERMSERMVRVCSERV